MEDDNPKEMVTVLSVIGVVEKRRTREWAFYKHGPPRLLLLLLLICIIAPNPDLFNNLLQYILYPIDWWLVKWWMVMTNGLFFAAENSRCQ